MNAVPVCCGERADCKVKVSQDTLGNYLFTLAEERLGVLLDQLKVVTGEMEGCLGVSATTSETWT